MHILVFGLLSVPSFSLLATTVQASPAHDLIDLAVEIDAICRGSSSSDRHLVETVCCIRSKFDVALNRMGYCYGKDGQVGSEMEWHKCTKTSLYVRPSDVAAYCSEGGD